MMRRICALAIAAAMILLPASAMAADGVITNYDQVIHVHTEFNAYGIATNSTTITTTTTTTTDDEGGVSTTVTVTKVESSWHGGSLKADTAHTVSDTESSDGSSSHSEYTDTYVYSSAGNLVSCSGSGSMTSIDGETGHTTSGSITRNFTVKDGQALLTSTTTSGTIKDKDGQTIGSFTNTTTIAASDYAYLGGSWVPMREVSVSTTNWENGGYEIVTRTTTYARNDQGVITGISRTASGERIVVTGEDGEEQSTLTFSMENYSASASFDSQMGWYISSEDFDWVLVAEERQKSNPEPELYGEVVSVWHHHHD